ALAAARRSSLGPLSAVASAPDLMFLSLTLHPPGRFFLPYTTLFRSLLPEPAEGPGPSAEDMAASLAFRLRRLEAFRAAAEQLVRSEEHTSELQSLTNLVCRLLLEKKKDKVNSRRLTHGEATLIRESQ